jgi:hypothetical protein
MGNDTCGCLYKLNNVGGAQKSNAGSSKMLHLGTIDRCSTVVYATGKT